MFEPYGELCCSVRNVHGPVNACEQERLLPVCWGSVRVVVSDPLLYKAIG